MKDLGEANVILNMKPLREGNGGVTLVLSHTTRDVWLFDVFSMTIDHYVTVSSIFWRYFLGILV